MRADPIMPPISRTTSLEQIRAFLTLPQATALRTRQPAWPLAQILEHCAQSIEYSMSGYPKLKPLLFRRVVGPLAYRKFARDGFMRHDLAAPVPGAPPCGDDVEAARIRLVAAIDRFLGYAGPFHEHLAFGRLDKSGYAEAHRMHIANHFEQIE